MNIKRAFKTGFHAQRTMHYNVDCLVPRLCESILAPFPDHRWQHTRAHKVCMHTDRLDQVVQLSGSTSTLYHVLFASYSDGLDQKEKESFRYYLKQLPMDTQP
jgi:hypothetical protein